MVGVHTRMSTYGVIAASVSPANRASDNSPGKHVTAVHFCSGADSTGH